MEPALRDIDALFPNFAARTVSCPSGKIFARIGGAGPPLLLLHGFPQSHVMWHNIAPALANRFTVIALDLPGYGWSVVPRQSGIAGWDKPVGEHGASMAKRTLALDCLAFMEKLGFATFACVAHDRGARVAYRLALDHPGRITKLALLDIVSTHHMWAGMDAARAIKAYHWGFLTQPFPLPETLIGANARMFLEHTLKSWTKAKTLDAFHPAALKAYSEAFEDPIRLHAMCEDYRAGAGLDRQADAQDLKNGNKISAPVLALWGEAGFPSTGTDPVTLWQELAHDVEGKALPCGHFMVEEMPQGVLIALEAFL